MEPVTPGQIRVKGIPMIHRHGSTEEVRDVHVNKMKSLLQKRQVRLRLMAEEARPPYPG